MKSSIYVSAEQIQVIGYIGHSAKRYVTYPLPEGTVYNGTITDSAFLTECLSSLRKDHSDLFKTGVTLIVDGSTILTRRLVAPKLNHKQYLQLVRDDFADSVDSTSNLVCGYHKMDSTENAILACAVNSTQVDSYITTFTDAGIKLSGIYIGVEAILSFVKATAELQKSTIVVNVIDGPTMLSMLFENGNNIFMSRSRLIGEEKEQIFQSVLQNLSGLIQFTKAQNIEDITNSYYLGISEADISILEAFNPYTDIKLGTLQVYSGKGEIPPDAHFACLNMLYGGGIDLLSARMALEKYVKSQRPKKLWIPILIVYFVVLAGIVGVLFFLNYQEQQKIDEIKAYLQTTEQKQREIEGIMRETAYYNEILRQMDEKTDWEDSLPKASSDTFDIIAFRHYVAVKVQSLEFDEKTGIVRVRATCADANVASDYVDKLYDMGVAETVEYRGYGSGGEGEFTFTIDITLKTGGEQ